MMNRLNYFNPYDSKDASHEDQLTRAYLALLSHSEHAFSAFLKYVRAEFVNAKGQKKLIPSEPLGSSEWQIETQRENPEIRTKYLLSVLITDAAQPLKARPVKKSQRNARYDGIVTLGEHICFVIENKPRVRNVWFNQLNPSIHNLGRKTRVLGTPICLEWKQIINGMKRLLDHKQMSLCERRLLEDFFAFVNEHKPYLNPFDKLHLCNGNPELEKYWLRDLLKSLLTKEGKIGCHRTGGYYIQTPYEEVQRVCFGLRDGDLVVGLYFGDTQRQAIEFYKRSPRLGQLRTLGWIAEPNFHVAFRSSNLVWFSSNRCDRYLKFWKDNVTMISQQKRSQVRKYLKQLADSNVITWKRREKLEVKKRFFDTRMSNLNMCPGFTLEYPIHNPAQLEKKGALKPLLLEIIREGLGVVGRNANRFLKR